MIGIVFFDSTKILNAFKYFAFKLCMNVMNLTQKSEWFETNTFV